MEERARAGASENMERWVWCVWYVVRGTWISSAYHMSKASTERTPFLCSLQGLEQLACF